MDDLFEGLEINEAEFTLPNDKVLRIVGLDIFQTIEVQKKIQGLSESSSSDKSALFKDIAKMSVVNDDYDPYLTEQQLNKLSRVDGGQILLEIFNKVMSLSGVSKDSAKEAKKK